MHVFIIAAVTADGFIAQDSKHLSTKWTSTDDAQWFNQRTRQAGVVVMGSTTFATIKRTLPGRVTIVYTQRPEQLVAEFSAVELRTNSLQPHLDPATLYVTKLSPTELLKILENQNFAEVAVCGGSSIYSLFVLAGVVQTAYLTVEPVLFGQGVSLFNQAVSAEIKLLKIHDLSDQTKVFEYSFLS